jgi:hypothetical protein
VSGQQRCKAKEQQTDTITLRYSQREYQSSSFHCFNSLHEDSNRRTICGDRIRQCRRPCKTFVRRELDWYLLNQAACWPKTFQISFSAVVNYTLPINLHTPTLSTRSGSQRRGQRETTRRGRSAPEQRRVAAGLSLDRRKKFKNRRVMRRTYRTGEHLVKFSLLKESANQNKQRHRRRLLRHDINRSGKFMRVK